MLPIIEVLEDAADMQDFHEPIGRMVAYSRQAG